MADVAIEDPKKRWANWNEDDLLKGGTIRLVYHESLHLSDIVVDLKVLYENGGSNLDWSKLDDFNKFAFANGIKQKLADGVAGAGKDYKLRHKITSENLSRLVDTRLWNKPGEGKGVRKYDSAIKALTDLSAQLRVANVPEETIANLQFEGKTLAEWLKVKKVLEDKKASEA